MKDKIKIKKVLSVQGIFKLIILLSVLGLIASLYLVYNHYSPPTKGSFCDFGETLSCSLVNTSVFSELFNVPVAIYGVMWFFILGVLGYSALRKKQGKSKLSRSAASKSNKTSKSNKSSSLTSLIIGLLIWSILGVLSVVYLIIAEIILRALCPLCTIVHIITLIALILVIYLLKIKKIKLSKLKWDSAYNDLKPWIGLAVILLFVIVFLFNLPTKDKANYDEFAKCITSKGINMYGSFRCGVCAKTRDMFGESFKYINEIECHPQGKNPQTELCIEKDIQGTPTWLMEPDGIEIKRKFGFMSIDELAEFSGCSLNLQNSKDVI